MYLAGIQWCYGLGTCSVEDRQPETCWTENHYCLEWDPVVWWTGNLLSGGLRTGCVVDRKPEVWRTKKTDSVVNLELVLW